MSDTESQLVALYCVQHQWITTPVSKREVEEADRRHREAGCRAAVCAYALERVR